MGKYRSQISNYEKGKKFEIAIAKIQEMMDPNAEIFHDLKIKDIHGHLRQFDVVIKGKLGGHELLGIIECKDWKKRVDTPVIDLFVTKCRDINANFSIIASKAVLQNKHLKNVKHMVSVLFLYYLTKKKMLVLVLDLYIMQKFMVGQTTI